MSLWTWMLWSVQQGCYIHWSENLNLTLITWAVKYPNFLSVFFFFFLTTELFECTAQTHDFIPGKTHSESYGWDAFWSVCHAQEYDGWFPNKKQVWGASSRETTSRWWMDRSAASPRYSTQRSQHIIPPKNGGEKNQEFLQETAPYTHTETTKLPHVDVLKYTNS